MKKREVFLLSSTMFSLGIVLGFMLSPIKKGILINNSYSGAHLTTDDNNKMLS